MLTAICAVGAKMEIGCKNKLIWRIPDDLAFFKRVTWGKTVLMGRKTFESIGHPLPGRDNWVVSGNKEFSADGVQIFCSNEEVLAKIKNKEVFLIGGASMYGQLLPYCDKLFLTVINDICNEADAFFPTTFGNYFKHKDVLETGRFDNTEYKIFELRK